MASPILEKIRDDDQVLQLESPVSTYVPFVGGGNTRMPFDDGINGSAYVELDKQSGAITLELYKGLPIREPAECGYRPTWRAQIFGVNDELRVYERSKGSDGNNCFDRAAHRPNLEEFSLALPPEIRSRVLGAFDRIDPETPSAQYTDYWKVKSGG